VLFLGRIPVFKRIGLWRVTLSRYGKLHEHSEASLIFENRRFDGGLNERNYDRDGVKWCDVILA
jgi:hypothetical protein